MSCSLSPLHFRNQYHCDNVGNALPSLIVQSDGFHRVWGSEGCRIPHLDADPSSESRDSARLPLQGLWSFSQVGRDRWDLLVDYALF